MLRRRPTKFCESVAHRYLSSEFSTILVNEGSSLVDEPSSLIEFN